MDPFARLDTQQRAAVEAGPGLLVVEAGAGTGKTTMMTARALKLLIDGVEPQSIGAVTFTRKAAREMRERTIDLAKSFDTTLGHKAAFIRFGTLHAAAARILRRHWQASGLSSANFLIADRDEETEIMKEAVLAAGVIDPLIEGEESAHAAAVREAADKCLDVIGRWKENGLSVEDMLDSHRVRKGEATEAIASVYVSYEKLMRQRNMVGLSDLTPMAVWLLERNESVRHFESASYSWLMVDEFQDTNPVQLRMLAQLTSAPCNLTVVGDRDQEIYSFRGVVPDLMGRVEEFFPHVVALGSKRVELITNRRCTDEILFHANLWVDYNPRPEPKILTSGRSGSPVTVSGHSSDKAEGQEIAKMITKLIRDGVDPGEIAVLARTGRALSEFGKAIFTSGVPHRMQAGHSFAERTEILDVLAYLKLAIDPQADLAFTRIAARPTRGVGAKAVQMVTDLARSQGYTIHNALSALIDGGIFSDKKVEPIAVLARQLSWMAEAARSGVPSEEMVRYVLSDVGYAAWAYKQTEPAKTLRDSFDALITMASVQTDFVEFMIDVCVDNDAEDLTQGAVHVGTLHGAKGLEWDHVFILGMEEGLFPSPRALKSAEEVGNPDDPWDTTTRGGIEEERRLAHVGLTRARHTAHLSFSVARRSNGPMKEVKPSRFLHEAELEIPRVSQGFSQAKSGHGKKPMSRRDYF
jgi:DNA helicase II / ATP-dependent DNA helicase PcrA